MFRVRQGEVSEGGSHYELVYKNNHMYGVVTENDNTMIALEYMPKGDLREFLIELRNT